MLLMPFISLAMQAAPAPAAPIAPTGPEAAVVTVADMDGDVLQLAPVLLDETRARRVIRATARRVFGPGTTYSAAFYLVQRRLASDLCEARQYRMELSGPTPTTPTTPGMRLTPGPVSELVHYAVVNPATTDCPQDGGYIDLADGAAGERQLAAYRRLHAAMAMARGQGRLPFTIACDSETPADCENTRVALASLPLSALFGITALGDRVRSPAGYFTRVPLAPGDPYDVEISFGMSGTDGKSWRVSWRETGGDIPAIRLRRSTIIYH